MSRRLMIIGIFLPWVAIGTAFAGFDEGLAAIKKGDYATALIELQPLADQGHAGAQSAIGDMYLNGHGTSQDDTRAVDWYRKAAEQGDTKALAALDAIERSERELPGDTQGG